GLNSRVTRRGEVHLPEALGRLSSRAWRRGAEPRAENHESETDDAERASVEHLHLRPRSISWVGRTAQDRARWHPCCSITAGEEAPKWPTDASRQCSCPIRQPSPTQRSMLACAPLR